MLETCPSPKRAGFEVGGAGRSWVEDPAQEVPTEEAGAQGAGRPTGPLDDAGTRSRTRAVPYLNHGMKSRHEFLAEFIKG